MWKLKTITLLLIFFVASNCAPVGDFCAVYEIPELTDEAARELVRLDRPSAEVIGANKKYALDHC